MILTQLRTCYPDNYKIKWNKVLHYNAHENRALGATLAGRGSVKILTKNSNTFRFLHVLSTKFEGGIDEQGLEFCNANSRINKVIRKTPELGWRFGCSHFTDADDSIIVLCLFTDRSSYQKKIKKHRIPRSYRDK